VKETVGGAHPTEYSVGKEHVSTYGAMVRGCDDFWGGIAAGGVVLRVFRGWRGLRFARRGRAPREHGGVVGQGFMGNSICESCVVVAVGGYDPGGGRAGEERV
jgi:hypothetical protein